MLMTTMASSTFNVVYKMNQASIIFLTVEITYSMPKTSKTFLPLSNLPWSFNHWPGSHQRECLAFSLYNPPWTVACFPMSPYIHVSVFAFTMTLLLCMCMLLYCMCPFCQFYFRNVPNDVSQNCLRVSNSQKVFKYSRNKEISPSKI